MDISRMVCGLSLQTPFILASGIAGNEYSLLLRALRSGASAVVTKTIFKDERRGYPPPIYYESPSYSINAVGLPGKGVHAFLEHVRKAKVLGKPIIVSVGGTSVEEYKYVAGLVAKSDADALELNLSCPHVEGTGTEFGSDPKLVKEVVEEVKSVAENKPVFAKLTPNTHSIEDLGLAAVEAGADGLTAVNTLRGMVFDPILEQPVLSNVYGGVSGRALHPVAVYCVYALRRALPSTPIFGVGGVYDIADAVDFFLAGADAVQVGTSISQRGYGVFEELGRGLAAYLERKGYNSLEEFVRKKRAWF
ncbi:MAG: dihydroorotate dehydrogenase [Thermoprotei archaeon]